MGQEPANTFTFAVTEPRRAPVPLTPPEQIGLRLDLERGLPWLRRRMRGKPLPPPR